MPLGASVARQPFASGR